MPIYKTKEKNKDGLIKYKVRINYAAPDGKAKQLTRIAYGLQDAKNMEYRLVNELKINHNANANDIKLNVLYEKYISYKKDIVRETTIKRTKQIISDHILPILGDYKLSKLDVHAFEYWKKEINKKDILIQTKHNIYSEFRTFLNYGIKMDYINKNNLVKVGNFIDPYENAQKKELNYYTIEEYKKFEEALLKEAIIKDYYDFYLFFMLAFYTGCRKGELHALTWNDINKEKNIININKSITQKLKGVGDVVTPPKNKSSNRKIRLPEKVSKILFQHYKKMKSIYSDFSNDYYICGGIMPLRDTSLANAQIRAEKTANLHHIRIHDFRHSHASLLINAGINIMEVSRRLGHSNITETLNTYSHLYPKEEEKAIEVLNSL